MLATAIRLCVTRSLVRMHAAQPSCEPGGMCHIRRGHNIHCLQPNGMREQVLRVDQICSLVRNRSIYRPTDRPPNGSTRPFIWPSIWVVPLVGRTSHVTALFRLFNCAVLFCVCVLTWICAWMYAECVCLKGPYECEFKKINGRRAAAPVRTRIRKLVILVVQWTSRFWRG